MLGILLDSLSDLCYENYDGAELGTFNQKNSRVNVLRTQQHLGGISPAIPLSAYICLLTVGAIKSEVYYTNLEVGNIMERTEMIF